MLCPIANLVSLLLQGGSTVINLPCVEERCAWWLASVKRCAVLETAISVSYLHNDMRAIARELSKLPSK